jgi:hypothetical protein
MNGPEKDPWRYIIYVICIFFFATSLARCVEASHVHGPDGEPLCEEELPEGWHHIAYMEVPHPDTSFGTTRALLVFDPSLAAPSARQ